MSAPCVFRCPADGSQWGPPEEVEEKIEHHKINPASSIDVLLNELYI